MPVSNNEKFWWIEKGETLHFKLAYIPDGMYDKERFKIKALAVPIMVHISSKPFSSGKKQQTCAGKDRCELCFAKHNPTPKYPVHVILWGDHYGKFNKTEKIIDMASSGHNALVAVIQEMIDNGATELDILETEFLLTRLASGKSPYYECTNVQSGEYVEVAVPDVTLEDSDIKILKGITRILNEKKIKNPRGSVVRTLKEKYEWPDVKIDLAFATVLDEEGRYVD